MQLIREKLAVFMRFVLIFLGVGPGIASLFVSQSIYPNCALRPAAVLHWYPWWVPSSSRSRAVCTSRTCSRNNFIHAQMYRDALIHPLMHYFTGFQFLPVDKPTFLTIQYLINLVLRHAAFHFKFIITLLYSIHDAYTMCLKILIAFAQRQEAHHNHLPLRSEWILFHESELSFVGGACLFLIKHLFIPD